MDRDSIVAAATESAEPYWFVRKAGWIQGPLTHGSLRHMYASGWVQALDMVANKANGPWCEARTCAGLQGDGVSLVQSVNEEGRAAADWEFASSTSACTAPVTFAMLQMLAAAGRLRPTDLVRHLPDGEWEQSRRVGGIFGGQRAWCSACGRALGADGARCRCGAPQPAYEHSLANVAMVCGGLAAAIFCVVIVAVTCLAWRGAVVLDVVMSEKFPQAFAVMLTPAAFLATTAVMLGRMTLQAMQFGRVAPGDRPAALSGLVLGVSTLIMLLAAAVAIISFSLAYFSW